MDFVENEAEESDVSSSEEVSDLDNENIHTIKSENQKKQVSKIMDADDDEDEDEEEDPLQFEEEMKDFINNEDEEEGDDEEGAGSEADDGKRKRDDNDEMDDRLDEEDFDLIEENTGRRVDRKKHHKRIRMMSDDEDSEDGGVAGGVDGKQAVKEALFDDDDDDDDAVDSVSDSPVGVHPVRHKSEFGDLDEEEESDIDDFIVDDEGRPISKGRKKRHIIHSDKALQEAQEIFGIDFNFDDFGEYSDELDEEDDYEDEELREESGEGRSRSRKQKKRSARKSIYEVYEPSELERSHFTAVDSEIRLSDLPERFQLRHTPVHPTEAGELEMEAEWIYKQAFNTFTISNQTYLDQDNSTHSGRFISRHGPSTVTKIKEAINFMRNQHLEVPFIAFYRKEYVEPELNIKDLWKVWRYDEKWTVLSTRKKDTVRLFERMQRYLAEKYLDKEELSAIKNCRPLADRDIERVRGVQTPEELRDVYQQFMLYYGSEIPGLHYEDKKREAESRTVDGNPAGEAAAKQRIIKLAPRDSSYTVCLAVKIDEIARQFGLQPREVGENLRDNYQRHNVQHCPVEPLELAKDYVCRQFSTDEAVMSGARHLVSMEIAHDPVVRQAVRPTYMERAKLSVRPVKNGLKLIDEGHACHPMKYLCNKPVRDLRDDQYLKLMQAEADGLLETVISIDSPGQANTYFDDVRSLYYRDEFSHLVQQWNIQRSESLKRALEKFLYPQFEKELRAKLAEEAREGVMKACCRRLYGWLKVAPYQADQQQLDDEYVDDENTVGVRVLGIAYSDERDVCSFGAMLDGDGVVTDYIRLACFDYRRDSFLQTEQDLKDKDMKKLKSFILNKKPHVIALSAENRTASRLADDVRTVLTELQEEEQIAPINVELVDNEVALISENSDKSKAEFKEYPPALRQAVSVARRIQDPLVEFAQMCNVDEDIVCVKYHPMQDQVSKEELLDQLCLEFVNRVNEVGVDINRCISYPHTAPLLQFVCGLGPRKASCLLKILKQNNSRLENRTQLVQMCHMGPKVFINCAGFIKLDTNCLGDSTDTYVDVLDGSRVHPEAYEWARKMAVDALEYDDTADGANPAGALEEILESPERLRDLDLDAFAEELERQGYGDKHITLYDIRAELNHRYKDLRTPYRTPTSEEMFNMLTKETPETFFVGRLVQALVTGFHYKRPQGEQLDNANPSRSEDTGLWQCPFCSKNDFPELSEVWNHFDGGNCQGSAIGVRARLDNGVSGFLHIRNISDKKVRDPAERVRRGQLIDARIIKIDIDRYQVELTCKSSDLRDEDGTWKPLKDVFYDYETETADSAQALEKSKQNQTAYIKRVIAHPNFKNIDYATSVRLMADVDVGDVIIRPSSKGTDHLTVTWKVCDGVLQHIDVIEQGKKNSFSLGTSLLVGDEEFEDLDEIIARHIQPMAGYARDVVSYRYYKPIVGDAFDVIDKMLIDDKKRQPSKIPYYLTPSLKRPGLFHLCFYPSNKPFHQNMKITPEGIIHRRKMFSSLTHMVRWFKDHFRDKDTPTASHTPAAGSVYATPGIDRHGMTPGGITPGRTPGRQMFGRVAPPLTPQPPVTPSMRSYQAPFAAGYQAPPPLAAPIMTPSNFVAPSFPVANPIGERVLAPSYQGGSRPMWPGTPQMPIRAPVGQGSQQPASLIHAVNSEMNRFDLAGKPNAVSAPLPGGRATGSSLVGAHGVPVGTRGAKTDWGRAAEVWAKSRQKEIGGGGDFGNNGDEPEAGGQRESVSDSVAPSLWKGGRGGGGLLPVDATPLIDEL